MRYLGKKELDDYEMGASILARKVKGDNEVILWGAEEDEVVASYYLAEESGYYITMKNEIGSGLTEKLEAKNLVEACASFNEVALAVIGR